MEIIVTVSPFLNDINYQKFRMIVKKVIDSDVHKFRVNFKKLTVDTCEYIDRAIKIIKDMDKEAQVILDLPYPYRKKRILINGYNVPYTVQSGEEIELNLPCTQNKSKNSFTLDYNKLPNVGDVLYYADGDGQFVVTNRKGSNQVIMQAQGSFEVCNNKSLHLIGDDRIPQETTCFDKVNLIISKNQVREVMVSFISSYKDIQLCQQKLDVSREGIIPKIETFKGIQNINEILNNCNKVLLARGDLALDLPVSKFGAACKYVSETVIKKNKELIVATDILASMETRFFPTRGDIIDLDKIVNEYNAKYIVLNSRLVNSQFYNRAINFVKEF